MNPSNPDTIEERAYQLWLARGGDHGSDQDDWYEAERQLSQASVSSRKVDQDLKSSFPASDPPASNTPDDPPVNAEEKWKAAGLSTADSKMAKKSPDRAARR